MLRLFPRAALVLLLAAAALAAAAPSGARPADHGTIPAASERPRCYGAASRDLARPCRNPRLDRMVLPRPRNAAREPRNLPCRHRERPGLLSICDFGTPAGRAVGTVALIGDSHAMNWRGPMHEALLARRWRGVGIAMGRCAYSLAVKLIRQPYRRDCVRWKRQVARWLDAHPEVTRVIEISKISSYPVRPFNGRTGFEAWVSGFANAFQALPHSVRKVIVIRDTPVAHGGTIGCVRRAMRSGARPASACAIARSHALPPDPAYIAARRSRSRRIATIDLTRAFCTRASCLPVIGGALVYRDATHMTLDFARTLGPLVARRLKPYLPRR